MRKRTEQRLKGEKERLKNKSKYRQEGISYCVRKPGNLCNKKNTVKQERNIKGSVQEGRKLTKLKDLSCSRREVFMNAGTVACYIVSMLVND